MEWRVPCNRLFKEIEELPAVAIKGKGKDRRHVNLDVVEYDEVQLANVLTAVQAWGVCLGVWLAKSICEEIHSAIQVHWEINGRLRCRIMAFFESFMDDECKSVLIVHSESCVSSNGTQCVYKHIRASNNYKTFMKNLHSQHPYILEVLQMCLQGTHFNFQNNHRIANSELRPWLLAQGFELDQTDHLELDHFDQSIDYFTNLRKFEVAHKAAEFMSEQDTSCIESKMQIMDEVIKKQPENSMVRSALMFLFDCLKNRKERGLNCKIVIVKGLEDFCRRHFVHALTKFRAAQLLTNDTSLNLLIKLTVYMIDMTQGKTVFSCACWSQTEVEDAKKLLLSMTEFVPLQADFQNIVNELINEL